MGLFLERKHFFKEKKITFKVISDFNSQTVYYTDMTSKKQIKIFASYALKMGDRFQKLVEMVGLFIKHS